MVATSNPIFIFDSLLYPYKIYFQVQTILYYIVGTCYFLSDPIATFYPKFRIFLWCTFFLLFLQADAILIFPKCCFSFITLFHSQYFINFTSHHYPTSMCLSNIYFLTDAILGIVDTMIKKKQKHKSLYSKENLKCCEEIKTKKASLYHVHSYFCA